MNNQEEEELTQNITENTHIHNQSQSFNNENTCQCGESQVQFYIIESNRHLCEKCAVNEIYKNESYERTVEKVWNKVKNIMKIRQKMAQVINCKHQSADNIMDNVGTQQQQQIPQNNEQEMTLQKVNLFYDLLHIEIEKLRRKSIEELNQQNNQKEKAPGSSSL